MSIIGTFLSVGILWFLITFFSRSTSSTQSLTETWIVVIGMMIVNLLCRWLLGGILGPFTLIVSIVALYFLIDKVCGTPRNITIRICLWYFGLSFLINVFFSLISG